MNGVIHKFTLPVPADSVSKVLMPVCAEVLSVGIQQDGSMVVWALVPYRGAPNVQREFVVVNTGAFFDLDLIAGADWVGTCVAADKIVWHVWKRWSS